MKSLLTAVCLVAGFAGQAEVISLTIGIDVNSPYGLSEPWVTIRDGLLRLDYVESVGNLPDRKTATGELRTKHGRVPDVAALAIAVRELGAGATLRGIEATVHGHLKKQGSDLLLKVSTTGETLRLAPLTKAIQRGADTPQAEREAFAKLSAQLNREPVEVRIIGPLRARAAPGAPQTLEVRTVDLRTVPQAVGENLSCVNSKPGAK